MKWLLDTNVVSDANRIRPSPLVKAWIEVQHPSDLFVSTVILAELAYGIAIVTDPNK